MTSALLLAALLAYDPVMCADGGGTPSLPVGRAADGGGTPSLPVGACVGDLSLPARVTDETPVVLLIHGGGWGAMDKKDVAGIADFLVRDCGCAVYNVNYRLASAKNPWPACGDDCVKAANFMFSEAFARAAGMRPKKIWVMGGSAGGHLALWTGLKLPAEKVAGIVSISGIADPEVDYPAHPGMYRGLFGGREVSREMRDAMSVMRLIRPNGPKILLTHATEDKVVPIASAKNFLAAYRSAGNEIGLFEYPSHIQPGLTGHCIWIPGSKPHKLIPRLEREIAYFIRPSAVPVPQPVKTSVDVTALYYPGTEHMPEWDMVRQVTPERRPLLGWYDEGDPENVDWQVKWAAEHGISSFCVCWYWNRGIQRLDHWVQAFYRAKHRRHLKWYVMYANHNDAGAHSTADQIVVTKFWIDNYFRTPEYYTVDGKPVVVYCTSGNLDRDFIAEARARGEELKPGEGIRRALAISEGLAKKAGLPGIYWIDMRWLRGKGDEKFSPAKYESVRRAGFDAAMTYNMGGSTPCNFAPEARQPGDRNHYCRYELQAIAAKKLADHADAFAGLPFWPCVPTGYDDRVRAFQRAYVIHGRTPEKFREVCEYVKGVADAKKLRHVVISPINEWQEGSYIEPCDEYGFAYYDAIRDTFGEKPAAGWPANVTPTSLGLPFHEFPPMMRSAVQNWTFDGSTEGWYRQPFGCYRTRCVDGCLSFLTTSDNNFQIRQRVQPFDPMRYKAFRLRMRICPNAREGLGYFAKKAPACRLKWGYAEDPVIAIGGAVDFQANIASCPVKPDGEWHEYVLDLKAEPYWNGGNGPVEELWFEAINASHAQIDIDWMRFE